MRDPSEEWGPDSGGDGQVVMPLSHPATHRAGEALPCKMWDLQQVGLFVFLHVSGFQVKAGGLETGREVEVLGAEVKFCEGCSFPQIPMCELLPCLRHHVTLS